MSGETDSSAECVESEVAPDALAQVNAPINAVDVILHRLC